jgi:hypothetical protein
LYNRPEVAAVLSGLSPTPPIIKKIIGAPIDMLLNVALLSKAGLEIAEGRYRLSVIHVILNRATPIKSHH